MTEDACTPEWMAHEESIRERTDEQGNRWRKAYFGGGVHFEHWLEQFREIYGEDSLEIEEIEPSGLACYERGGEKMYRIWVRERRNE